jgi:uncharacterized protein YheU (UPF0270 family)
MNEDTQSSGFEIPHAMLQPETLTKLIMEFVLREGTDYGEHAYSVDEKIAEVRRQIEKGHAKIVFDPKSESCNIIAVN